MNQTATSLISRLRDCNRRADDARRRGDSEGYRRLVEEYIFISSTCASGPRSLVAKGAMPCVVVLHENTAVVELLREGLIEFRYAAHVVQARSLIELAAALERVGEWRPWVFVIIAPLRLDSGLAALQLIRQHRDAHRHPILMLSDDERGCDSVLALAAGASAHAKIPDDFREYRGISESIRRLVGAHENAASA